MKTIDLSALAASPDDASPEKGAALLMERRQARQNQLYAAVEANDPRALELALANKANPWLSRDASNLFESAFEKAIEMRSLLCLPRLARVCGGLVFAPKPNAPPVMNALEFALAARDGHLSVAQMLESEESRDSFTPEQKQAAFESAVGGVGKWARQELLALALCRHAEPSREQWGALVGLAISRGEIEILRAAAKKTELKTLKATNPFLKRRDQVVVPLLTLAASSKFEAFQAVEFLLAEGCDPFESENGVESPLVFALDSGSLEPVQALLLSAAKKAPARLDEALLQAATGAAARVLGVLAAAGAKLSARDEEGRDALMAVIAGDNGQKTERVGFLAPLLAEGQRDRCGKSALDLALDRKEWWVADLLLPFLPAHDAQRAILAFAQDEMPFAARRMEAMLIEQAAQAGIASASAPGQPAAESAAGNRPKARRPRSL